MNGLKPMMTESYGSEWHI